LIRVKIQLVKHEEVGNPPADSVIVEDITVRKRAEKPYARQRLNWRMSHG
jgi:hypothetical protein